MYIYGFFTQDYGHTCIYIQTDMYIYPRKLQFAAYGLYDLGGGGDYCYASRETVVLPPWLPKSAKFAYTPLDKGYLNFKV